MDRKGLGSFIDLEVLTNPLPSGRSGLVGWLPHRNRPGRVSVGTEAVRVFSIQRPERFETAAQDIAVKDARHVGRYLPCNLLLR